MAKRNAPENESASGMPKELMLIKERKCKKETMATGYYFHERSPELEAVERWENEGGRLGQKHEYIFASIREDYRHKDQVMQVRRLPKRDEIPHPMVLASDKAKSISDEQWW